MPTASDRSARLGGRLLQLGALLFLLGLLTGFGMPAYANPRMGLASHLEGVMNGLLLLVLGLLWPRLSLSPAARVILFWLAIYGAFINWATVLFAAVVGAGTMMPLAAGEHAGTPAQEMLVNVGLWSLSAAIVAAIGMVIWGLRHASRWNPAQA